MLAISVGLPVRRLGHQARERQRTSDRKNGKKQPFLIETKAELTDAEERGINEHASEDPTQQISTQVARDRHVTGQLGYRLPASDLREYFCIKLDERVLGHGRSQESNGHPNQRGD